MPVRCPSNSGLSSASFSSNSDEKPTMFGSDPLLCKSNNNKISEQNENERCVNGNGYLDNGRRRACSASNALTITKQKNGYSSTHLLNGYNAAQSRQHCRDISMLLAYDIIRMKCKKENTSSWFGQFTSNGVHQIENDYTKTLRRTVSEISQRHEILFTSMVEKLNLSRENFEELFNSVVDDIFSDGHLNWGRIVTVYALEGRIAEYMSNNGMDDCLNELAEKVGSYVDDVIGDWIMENGGWDAFVRFFPDRTGAAEEKLWNGLVLGAACVGAAGLATLFAMKT